MVVKAQLKASLRLYLKHISRFITIMCIVIVSIGFMSGIGEVENKLIASNNYYYDEYNLADINIKSKSDFGFSSNDINLIKEAYGEDNVNTAICYDVENENEITRL